MPWSSSPKREVLSSPETKNPATGRVPCFASAGFNQLAAGHWQHESPPAPGHEGAELASAQAPFPWALYPSVYQPPPLSWKELIEISFLTSPPQSGQADTGASAKRC